ncbi:MAG TPA: hypothetical protein VF211_10580 [Burkholderiales bacterium]
MRVLLAALLLLALPCVAQERARELLVGAGTDVVHRPGLLVARIASDPLSLLVWDEHLDFGVALSHRFGTLDGWSASLGGIVVRHTDGDLGTHANFLLGASYCRRRLCLSYAHISHGAVLGIAPRKSNSGLNFLLLERRFR